jgi:site-specific recombinase XerC
MVDRYRPIDDYALLSDCHSVALVSREGSIDWCCMPRVDSASVFGRLLDADRGGFCAIRVDEDVPVSRRYRYDTRPGRRPEGRPLSRDDAKSAIHLRASAARPVQVADDWAVLVTSWQLALEADGNSPNTRATYRKAVASLAGWMAAEHPELGPVDLDRDLVRGWLAWLRRASSSATAKAWFSGVRSFCRWMVDEGEVLDDATAGVRAPRQGEPHTPVLNDAELRRLLRTVDGADFASRRDAAILLLFLDGGLRLAECAGLQLDDVDLPDRLVYVQGKASARSGPRLRAVPLGAKATRALDRYLRSRRRHQLADRPALWLGTHGRTLGVEGVDSVVKRRAAQAGLKGVHPHQLRHTWASAFRAAGGSEGDLLVLGGWRSRAQLDRYGRATAAQRAAEAARRYSLGDRL